MPGLTTLELLAFIHILGFQKDFQPKEVFPADRQRNTPVSRSPAEWQPEG